MPNFAQRPGSRFRVWGALWAPRGRFFGPGARKTQKTKKLRKPSQGLILQCKKDTTSTPCKVYFCAIIPQLLETLRFAHSAQDFSSHQLQPQSHAPLAVAPPSWWGANSAQEMKGTEEKYFRKGHGSRGGQKSVIFQKIGQNGRHGRREPPQSTSFAETNQINSVWGRRRTFFFLIGAWI